MTAKRKAIDLAAIRAGLQKLPEAAHHRLQWVDAVEPTDGGRYRAES